MAEARYHHGITDGVLQAFITGREFAGTMVEHRVGLCHHHNPGGFPVAQPGDGIVDCTALRFPNRLFIKKFNPDDAIFEELYRRKIKADTFNDFHNLKVIYFLEESNFTKRFI